MSLSSAPTSLNDHRPCLPRRTTTFSIRRSRSTRLPCVRSARSRVFQSLQTRLKASRCSVRETMAGRPAARRVERVQPCPQIPLPGLALLMPSSTRRDSCPTSERGGEVVGARLPPWRGRPRDQHAGPRGHRPGPSTRWRDPEAPGSALGREQSGSSPRTTASCRSLHRDRMALAGGDPASCAGTRQRHPNDGRPRFPVRLIGAIRPPQTAQVTNPPSRYRDSPPVSGLPRSCPPGSTARRRRGGSPSRDARTPTTPSEMISEIRPPR